MLLTKFLLIFVFSSSFANAEMRQYYFKCADFPGDKYPTTSTAKAFTDTGKITITDAGGQPFRMTNLTRNYNGKWCLWTVTPKTDAEQKQIEAIPGIVLISTMDVILQANPNRGGHELVAIFSGELSKLPTDYYEVQVSSK